MNISEAEDEQSPQMPASLAQPATIVDASVYEPEDINNDPGDYEMVNLDRIFG